MPRPWIKKVPYPEKKYRTYLAFLKTPVSTAPICMDTTLMLALEDYFKKVKNPRDSFGAQEKYRVQVLLSEVYKRIKK